MNSLAPRPVPPHTSVVSDEILSAGRPRTYWGPGLLVGQGVAFLALGLPLTTLLIWAVPTYGWNTLSALLLGAPAALLFWLAVRPRVRVTADAVVLYSYVRSITVPRSEIAEAVGFVHPRTVIWFHGAEVPELALPNQRRVLLPMFTTDEFQWFQRLPHWFLRSPRDLGDFQVTADA